MELPYFWIFSRHVGIDMGRRVFGSAAARPNQHRHIATNCLMYIFGDNLGGLFYNGEHGYNKRYIQLHWHRNNSDIHNNSGAADIVHNE